MQREAGNLRIFIICSSLQGLSGKNMLFLWIEMCIRDSSKYSNYICQTAKFLQQHYIAIMELVSELYRFSVNNDVEVEELSADMRNLYSTLLDLEPEALKKWLMDISLSFREELIRARTSSTKSFVRKAQEYVRNNFSYEELSLDHICAALGVSNSYFSTIFKKETGNTFIGYLTDYSMDQAARLLTETGDKSYIIAKKVGYTDPNYFSYVFKRRFGVSPSKYRAEHTESEK